MSACVVCQVLRYIICWFATGSINVYFQHAGLHAHTYINTVNLCKMLARFCFSPVIYRVLAGFLNKLLINPIFWKCVGFTKVLALKRWQKDTGSIHTGVTNRKGWSQLSHWNLQSCYIARTGRYWSNCSAYITNAGTHCISHSRLLLGVSWNLYVVWTPSVGG